MSELPTKNEVSMSLERLAVGINEGHRAFVGSLRKTTEHGIRCGELLAEAKLTRRMDPIPQDEE